MYTEDEDDYTSQTIGNPMFKIYFGIRKAFSLAGWKSVAVTGEVHGLWTAHTKFGTLPWKTIVNPAVNLAKKGFPVSESLALALQNERDSIINETTMRFQS